MFPLRQARPESIIIPTLLLTGSAGGGGKNHFAMDHGEGMAGDERGGNLDLILSSLPSISPLRLNLLHLPTTSHTLYMATSLLMEGAGSDVFSHLFG